MRTFTLLVTALALCSGTLLAQERVPVTPPLTEGDTLGDRTWISVQANVISQRAGGNDLSRFADEATSRVATLYGGFRVTRSLELLGDVEAAGGTGVIVVPGLGAIPDVDDPAPLAFKDGVYLARAMVHYTIGFGSETELVTRNPLSLASLVPVRRLEIRAGKLSPIDFFDLNAITSDSHSQFTNTAIVNNGVYDYASDARGYTWGAVAEYYSRSWAIRFGEMIIPNASDINVRWAWSSRRSENVEVESHTTRLLNRPSVVRALAFVNHKPEATTFGLGLNGEHELSDAWRAFWRIGWNDGRSTTSNIDESLQIGADTSGRRWHRDADRAGAALVVNGLTMAHRHNLEQLVGSGFEPFAYRAERAIEAYYNVQVWRGVSMGVAYQVIGYPGYDRDRGVVPVLGLRLHVEAAIPLTAFTKSRGD